MLRHTCPRAQHGSNQWKGAQTSVREAHFLVLEPEPKGQASHLMHTWGPAGVLSGDGDWRAPSLYSTALQPVGIIFLFFFFFFLFSFSFFFPSGHHLYTLPLSLPPPAGGHHLCVFPLPHSRVPASPRGELLHTSGAPVFTSGAPIFAAAIGCLYISWLCWPVGLTLAGPTRL